MNLRGRGKGYFVATTGIIEAKPNASNVIPGSARLVIDARGEFRETLLEFRERLEKESLALALDGERRADALGDAFGHAAQRL